MKGTKMCKFFTDVNNNRLTLQEAIKIIPNGEKCYRTHKDQNGELQTELCPFLDWIMRNEFYKEEDFMCTGFCHLLKNGDWSSPETGEDIETVQLARTEKPTTFNSKQEPTVDLWDCKKNCNINLKIEDSEQITE